MKLQKTQLAAAVGAALMVGAAQAQVQPAQPGINVQLYGQMHRAVMLADDGHQSKWFHVDGQPSSTRIGINATGQVLPGLRAGGRIETEFKSNPSNVVNFGTPSTGALAGGVVGFAERWLDVSLEGGWGRINMGQGSGAADDASTNDLSGTNLANGTCPSDWGGGLLFRTSGGGTTTTPVGNQLGGIVGMTGDCNDFESRYDRIMYTTPTFGGFRAQFGQGQRTAAGESTEASIWYNGKMGGLGEIAAAIGWSSVNLGTAAGVADRETIGGSISWLHSSGFNLTFAHTQVEGISLSATDSREGKFTWMKVGFRRGAHAFAVDYGMYDDMAAAGDEGKSWGLGYQWTPVRWMELYAGYHMFTLDRPAVDLEDIKVFAIGSRVRF